MEPKLISYIGSKYQTKSDRMYDKALWAEIIEPMLPRFKEARPFAKLYLRCGTRKAASFLPIPGNM